MQEDWLEIRLTLPAAAAELVGPALMELGCTGITVAERALDTFDPPDPDFEEPQPTIRAYFPTGDPEQLRRDVQAALADLAPVDAVLHVAHGVGHRDAALGHRLDGNLGRMHLYTAN